MDKGRSCFLREMCIRDRFYETHSGGLNTYHAPMLSSAMADVMYFVSNGYIVFMPDACPLGTRRHNGMGACGFPFKSNTSNLSLCQGRI